MSTFDGTVKEFPDIRIDHFRLSVETSRPPLAYFLSHVHSDHLEGLESFKSPFIYCSPATKEILLRLEKYPHRMNFAKGILEARKQTYKHLRKLLKTIPFETPTVIDLAPGRSIRVTLFDANHCVGAVMFLIEGDGKSVLYTGDIRSELWWVNNLARHPLMLAYTLNGGKASLKQLDCIYLDTTFASTSHPKQKVPWSYCEMSQTIRKVQFSTLTHGRSATRTSGWLCAAFWTAKSM
jgi:DNA cross-link repair 1C protein